MTSAVGGMELAMNSMLREDFIRPERWLIAIQPV
jgi:hypothetical protein